MNSLEIRLWDTITTFTTDTGSVYSILDENSLHQLRKLRRRQGESLTSLAARLIGQGCACRGPAIELPLLGNTVQAYDGYHWVTLSVLKCLSIPAEINNEPMSLIFLIVEDGNRAWKILGQDNIHEWMPESGLVHWLQ